MGLFKKKNKRIDTSKIKANKFEKWFAKLNFNADFRIRLYKKLATGIINGVKDISVISELQRRYERKSLKDPRAICLRDIYNRVLSTGSVVEGLRGWASSEEISILEAGYASGNAPDAYHLVIKVIQNNKKMKSAIIKSLTYPALLLTVALGVVYFIGSSVVPKIEDSVGGMTEWSGQAQSLFSLSSFVQSDNFIYLLVGLVVGLIVIFKTLSSPWTKLGLGKLRKFLDRLPPWSIYKDVQGATFMISLASMLSAGIPMQSSLIRIAKNSSEWTKHRVTQIVVSMNRGNPGIGDAMESTGYNFPDMETIDDIRFFQNMSDVERVLHEIGEENIDRTLERIQKAAGFLSMLALFIMIGMVFWIVAGVLGIQSDISDNIG